MENYEKIILELMMRVQKLEEQVMALSEEKTKKAKKIGTVEIKAYIMSLKETAFDNGEEFVVLKANDIHKNLGLQSRMPAVCTAMRQCMNPTDIVLHETPSGFSSTFEVKYNLNV